MEDISQRTKDLGSGMHKASQKLRIINGGGLRSVEMEQ